MKYGRVVRVQTGHGLNGPLIDFYCKQAKKGVLVGSHIGDFQNFPLRGFFETFSVI